MRAVNEGVSPSGSLPECLALLLALLAVASAVMELLVLIDWADHRRAIAEEHRVLRPGGAFKLPDVLAAGVLRPSRFAVLRRVPAPHFAQVTQVVVARRRDAIRRSDWTTPTAGRLSRQARGARKEAAGSDRQPT